MDSFCVRAFATVTGVKIAYIKTVAKSERLNRLCLTEFLKSNISRGIYLTGDTDTNTRRGMAKVRLSGCRCERCHHRWLPRQGSGEPRVCPKCKSPYWNR